jgi:hypothetical protein
MLSERSIFIVRVLHSQMDPERHLQSAIKPCRNELRSRPRRAPSSRRV